MFKGIIPPVITPFKPDYSVDETGYADVIEYMIDGGVHGIIIGGTTGEFYAMSASERVHQFQFAKSVINGRVPMICGVNDLSTKGACDLAIAARNAGADGLLLAAPPYSLPTENELAAHCIMIDEVADLPIMLYNYPGRTGVHMGVDFLNLVSKKSNFQCIKEASGDVDRLHLLVNEYSNIELSCGAEDQALEFFVWGATSWVTPMGNFIIKEVVNFYDTCTHDKDYDKARQMMQALLPLTSIIESGGKFAQSVKFAAAYQGLPTGPVRPPMQEMTAEFETNLKETLVTTQAKLNNIISS